MGKQFSGHENAFADFARSDYSLLIEAYGDQPWDLTDPEKKKYIKRTKGGLICFCFLKDEFAATTPAQLKHLKSFKDEPFVTNGCTKISKFMTDTLINGIYISVVIAILNSILQSIITSFVENIGYDSHTIESEKVKFYMFLILFFNTGLIMMFIAANLNKQIPIIGHYFKGQYKDFTSNWFVIIGAQVVLNSLGDLVSPPIAYYVNEIVFAITMCFDQGKCRKKKRYPPAHETKCRTIGEYYEMYVGPVYVIENNQAAILNFILTCFMYGAGLPILFPISLLCLISLYLFEKKMITRQVRLPCNFNPKMNDQIVSMCLVGPILYSAIGFWMYTNPAIIGNHVKPIHTIQSKQDTQHRVIESITQISPGTPFLILFVISVLAKLDHHFKF